MKYIKISNLPYKKKYEICFMIDVVKKKYEISLMTKKYEISLITKKYEICLIINVGDYITDGPQVL